jgi:hypothetical protein
MVHLTFLELMDGMRSWRIFTRHFFGLSLQDQNCNHFKDVSTSGRHKQHFTIKRLVKGWKLVELKKKMI